MDLKRRESEKVFFKKKIREDFDQIEDEKWARRGWRLSSEGITVWIGKLGSYIKKNTNSG